MPLMSMMDAFADALVSRVSTAITVPPSESPMNNTPSLPNARAPADLSWTLPVVAPGMPALNANAAVRQAAPKYFANLWRIRSPWTEVTPESDPAPTAGPTDRSVRLHRISRYTLFDLRRRFHDASTFLSWRPGRGLRGGEQIVRAGAARPAFLDGGYDIRKSARHQQYRNQG